jgi:hypothetical protein
MDYSLREHTYLDALIAAAVITMSGRSRKMRHRLTSVAATAGLHTQTSFGEFAGAQ